MDMQELKEKVSKSGYMSLNKEEKDFYQVNKGVAQPTTPTQPEVRPDENITISKKDLDKVIDGLLESKMKAYQANNSSLQEQVKGLESTAGLREWQVWKDPVKGNKIATFRVYQEDGNAKAGLIVDRKWLKNARNENTMEKDIPVYEITVLYADGTEKKHELELVELTRLSGMEKVEIIEWKMDKVFKSEGSITRTASDNSGYKLYKDGKGGVMAVQSEDEVDALVFRDVGTCICKRTSGQEFEVNIDRLNCA